MTGASDGPGARPGEQPVPQTGRPPVPRPLPSDAAPSAAGPSDAGASDAGLAAEDRGPAAHGGHATEQVPFPLPPLLPGGPAPVAGPPTGQLDLGGYPPRVPGTPAPRPGAGHQDQQRDGDQREDGAPRER